MADAAPLAPDRWCAPSAKPELAPRTAAPPGSPGTTPLGAARSTKGGMGRRCLGRGDAAPELPGTDGQLDSVTSPACAHPPARPRSWVIAQVGCWVSWPGWSWLDCWDEGLCYLSTGGAHSRNKPRPRS